MSSFISRAYRSLSIEKRARANYASMVEDCSLDDHSILIESQQGRTPCGNMFYILKYLASSSAYEGFSLAFVYQKSQKAKFELILESSGISGVELVPLNSPRYLLLLATAKYLITDTSFPPYYIKKKGQIVWNTWHGTPLKALGRSDKSAVATLGNVQKNLALADYLSFPNEFTAQRMLKDYMIDRIYNGTIIYSGYPRNCVFHSSPSDLDCPNSPEEHTIDELRDTSPISSRYAYMPTWRPAPKGMPRHYASAHLIYHLIKLDSLLRDDEILYVNIHPLDAKNVNLNCFKHIKPFPSDVETYAFLNSCDALITDYSSVLFDFAPTKKPIVLFTFDEDEYLHDRGMYLSLDDLPFSRVKSCSELLYVLRDEKSADESNKYSDLLSRYCSFESASSTELQCDYVILGKDNGVAHQQYHDNGRDNVIIYGGNLSRNGITTSLLNLMNYVKDDGRNYFIAVPQRQAINNIAVVSELPEWLQYIPYVGKTNMSLFQKAVQYYYGKKKHGIKLYTKYCDDAYKLNLRRRFGFVPNVSAYIQFNGYGYKEIEQFSVADTKKIIYMHSDVEAEAKVRGNTQLNLLRYAYSRYDTVAVVSEGLLPVANRICPSANVKVVPNLFDAVKVRKLAEANIAFDPETVSNVTVEELVSVLNDPTETVIISIGRFSPEKGHIRLFDEFARIRSNNPDEKVKLIVIGGNSFYKTYEDEIDYVSKLDCAEDIYLIKAVSNPYAILKRCDGFILPSTYEGFGLVLIEADALGIPVVSTDIDGPRAFMQKHGGTLVPNSTEGVGYGLKLLIEGAISPMSVDYDQYNRDAYLAFEQMLSE